MDSINNSARIETQQKFTPTTKIPDVQLMGMHLQVNGKKFSLTRKAKAYRVIKAFFNSESPAMTAAELIEFLDREEGLPTKSSPRSMKYKHAALVRMFSRMREEFGRAFKSSTPDGTSWFHYDRMKNVWVLFRMPSTGADGLSY